MTVRADVARRGPHRAGRQRDGAGRRPAARLRRGRAGAPARSVPPLRERQPHRRPAARESARSGDRPRGARDGVALRGRLRVGAPERRLRRARLHDGGVVDRGARRRLGARAVDRDQVVRTGPERISPERVLARRAPRAGELPKARAADTKRAGPADEARETRAFVEATTRDSAGTAEAAVRVKVGAARGRPRSRSSARASGTVLVADGVEVDARGVATSCDGRPMSGRAVSYAWDVVDAVTGARLPLASSSRDAQQVRGGRRRARAGAYDLVATVVDDAYGFATNGSVRLRVERSALVARVAGGATGPCFSPTARWPWRARLRPRRQGFAPLAETWSCAFGNDACGVTADARKRTRAVALDRGAGAYVRDARRGGDGRPRGDGRGHVRGAGGGLSARERRAALDRRRRRRERAARRRRVPGRRRRRGNLRVDGRRELRRRRRPRGRRGDGVAGDAVVDGATTVQSLVIRARRPRAGRDVRVFAARDVGRRRRRRRGRRARASAPRRRRRASCAWRPKPARPSRPSSNWRRARGPRRSCRSRTRSSRAADAGADGPTRSRPGRSRRRSWRRCPRARSRSARGTRRARGRTGGQETGARRRRGEMDRRAPRDGRRTASARRATPLAAATATAPTGGLNETVALALAEAAAASTRLEDLFQVVAAAAGLLGSETRRRLQLDDAAAGEPSTRCSARWTTRALHGRRVERRRRAVRRGAARARARDRGRGAARGRPGAAGARPGAEPVARPAGDGDRRRRARQQRGRPRRRRRGRAGVGPVRGRREAAPRRDGRGRGRVAGAVDDIAAGARRGRRRRRGARGRRVGHTHTPSPRRGRRRARRSTRAARRRSTHHPTDRRRRLERGERRRRLPRGAGRRGEDAAVFSLRGGGRRAAAPRERNAPGNATLECPPGTRAQAAATGAVANATVYCPWNYVGPSTAPARRTTPPWSTRATASGASSGCFAASSGGRLRRLGRRRVGPGRVRGGPGAVDGERDGVASARAEDGGARDYSTATTARSFAKAYLRNLVGPVDPEKSAVILGFLGVVVFASALAAICGHRLDKRDATLRRGRRLVLSHSSSFCWAPRPATSRRPWGQARGRARRAALIHLPGSRPRTSPNDEEAASPADERARRLARGGLARAPRPFTFRRRLSSQVVVARAGGATTPTR